MSLVQPLYIQDSCLGSSSSSRLIEHFDLMFKESFTRREPKSSQEAGLVTSAQGKVLSFPGDI